MPLFNFTSPTISFIQFVLAAHIVKYRQKFVVQRIVGELDWSFLEQWVSQNGMDGIFTDMVPPSILPDSLGERWKNISTMILVRNVRLLNIAINLFSLLEKAEIHAAAMRGLTLAHREYSNPGIRPMEDIDILVPPSRRSDLLDVLKKNGLEPEKLLRSQDVFRINGFYFEIHYSFLTAKRYRRRIDTDAFIASRQPVETKDGVFYCLSDEYELIGLVTHAFIHHDLAVPKQLVDIALYVQKDSLDWEFVYRWCCSMKLVRMFSLTLYLVKHLFHMDVPGFEQTFGRDLSHRVINCVDTYLYPFFGMRCLRSYFGHKHNMLYVAEGPLLKLNQLACFLSVKEARVLFSYLFSR